MESPFLQLSPLSLSILSHFCLKVLCDHSALFSALWLLQASINHEHYSPWCVFFNSVASAFSQFYGTISLNLQDCQDELGRNRQNLDLFPTKLSIFAKTKSREYPQWDAICPCHWEPARKSFHSQEMIIWHDWHWNSAR